MKTRNITHIISTDLKRNVFDIVNELTVRNVDVVDTLIPKNIIYINAPKEFKIESLAAIKGVQEISSNNERSW